VPDALEVAADRVRQADSLVPEHPGDLLERQTQPPQRNDPVKATHILLVIQPVARLCPLGRDEQAQVV
jgi:hypothetical protein